MRRGSGVVEQLKGDKQVSVIQQEAMYQQIVEYSFETTVIHSNQKVLYINQAGADFLRATKENIIGANIVDLFTNEYKDFIVERIRKNEEENIIGELIETTIYRLDGTLVEVELYCHPVYFGKTKAIQSIVRDITPRKEAQRKLRQVVDEVSIPLVPVLDGIAVLPLVGMMDQCRSEQVLDSLPKKIQGRKLTHLIIDVSGIYNFDEVVAQFLFKINAIVSLLGITLIYTGFRPELAQKAVQTGIDISSVKTMINVKMALRMLME
ncbi:PAS domain S-box protein [Bacillus sp. NTK071]|nr:PAS domain S-box protein [Bacillus sp. NTK071]